MTWEEIRQKYPSRWLVVEAFGAYTENGCRVFPTLIPVGMFEQDWKEAWHHYGLLHDADKWREMYVFHTDHQELKVGVLDSRFRPIKDDHGTL